MTSAARTLDDILRATPEHCELVYLSLKSRPEGATVSNLSYFTGISRILVIDALEQMLSRGAVRHNMCIWFATPKD